MIMGMGATRTMPRWEQRGRRQWFSLPAKASAVAIVSVCLACTGAASAEVVNAIANLPLSVKAVYENLCHADFWIGNKRVLEGSTSATFGDGTTVFLLVCGDAASSVPYSVIVMAPSGDAREAPVSWTFHGKALDDGGLGNARFGSQTDTIVSSGHVSATCEPTYTHRWNGSMFQLVNLNKAGCKRGEF